MGLIGIAKIVVEAPTLEAKRTVEYREMPVPVLLADAVVR